MLFDFICTPTHVAIQSRDNLDEFDKLGESIRYVTIFSQRPFSMWPQYVYLYVHVPHRVSLDTIKRH